MSTVTSINLSEHGLIAIHCANDDDACAFYNATRSLPYIKYGASDESFFIFKAPGAGRVVGGYALFEDVVYLPPYAEDIELEGTLDEVGDIPEALLLKTEELPNFPELPAEFFRQAQQSSLFDDIPNQLKRFDQWVLWRYAERGDKTTKLPFQPTGGMAKSNDPATWSSFESVRHTFAEGGFSGIGFVLSEQDGLAGIDLDKCYDPVTKTFTQPEAEEIVRRALELGTYVEISPSGSGIRIFVAGSLQRSGKAPGELSWIEAYDHRSARYLTVTGHDFEGSASEIKPGQAFLDWLHDTYLKKPERPKAIPQAEVRPERDDEELIRHIRSSRGEGTRFAELFDQGNHVNGETGEVNEDRSAADFALCGILARWTERNAAQIDRVFRRSALMRDKWDERHASDGRTYGQITVENAITGCDQTREEWLREQQRTNHEFVAESLKNANPETLTSAEFAIALYRLKQNDELGVMRLRKSEAFKNAGLTKKDVDAIISIGAKHAKENEPERTPSQPLETPPIIKGAIAELNAKFCVCWMGGNLNVMRYVVSEQHVNGGYLPTTQSDVKNWYANKLIEIPNPAGNSPTRVNPVDVWWKSKEREEYDGVEFYPGQNKVISRRGERILNLWGGWAIEPQDGDISPFLELLLRVVCADDSSKMDRALDWMAHLFQQPDYLPSTALLFRGGQGWGKNSVIDTLAKPLGSGFFQVSSTKHLTGDFNAHLADKLLIHGAESVWGGEKSKVGNLKAMITDEHQAVEHKGRDVFQVRNFKRLILSSNEKWPIPMDLDDRRFLVFTNQKVWATGDPFWNQFRLWRGDNAEWEGAARLFGYLLNRDISNFKPWAKPEEFTDGWDLKIKNSDAVTQWWYAVLRDGEPEKLTSWVDSIQGKKRSEIFGSWEQGAAAPLAVKRSDFWAAYTDWVKQTGTRSSSHEQEWKNELKKLCPSLKEKQLKAANRSVCFVFPDLAQCRLEFSKALGAGVNEVFADSADPVVAPEDEDAYRVTHKQDFYGEETL